MNEIKFLINDYLEQLKERDELDAILPDLLIAMGYQIEKLAFKGEVEHGVDIAAYLPDSKSGTLLLIQVKAGNIDQNLWDTGPNCVRATLNNMKDVPYKDLTKQKLRKAKRKIILAHNGILRENIREKFNGYIKNELKDFDFDRWDISELTDYFYEYLYNERLFPKDLQKLLKRTLVFLDVNEYDFSDYKILLQSILPTNSRLSKKDIRKFFTFLRPILSMITNQGIENDHISIIIKIHEYTLLYLWGWMVNNKIKESYFLPEYSLIYHKYLATLYLYIDKLKPILHIKNGLFLGGPSEKVEYPMRFFNVISNLGILTISTSFLSANNKIKELCLEISNLLSITIQNNPSRHRPLLDNNQVDIFIGLWGLLYVGKTDEAISWIFDLFRYLTVRKNQLGALPVINNNIDAVIEFEATGVKPPEYRDSSSTLIYFLFELCVLFNLEGVYNTYRPVFEDINFQVWYPPENVEEDLYFKEIHGGDTEVIHSLPKSFSEFRLDVEARHQFDSIDYSPIKYNFPVLLLLASKYYRTPIFPFWWRNSIFQKSPDSE